MATLGIVRLVGACVILSLGGGENIALHKQTWMSSTRRVQYSRRAVDGVTDAYNESLTIHTSLREPNAWWKVDLGTEVQSPLIIIYFRTDYKVRRNGLQFYGSVTSSLAPKNGSLFYTVRGRRDGRDIADILNVTCNESFRFLTIYTETTNDNGGPVLDFAEVEVWNTYQSQSPFTEDDDDDTHSDYDTIQTLISGSGLNVALHKRTSMSSTRRVQYSARAVDGQTDGTDESLTIHTKEDEPTAWWKVDLNVEVHSPMIRIFFRFDYPRRRNGIQFYTSRTDSTNPKEGDLCYTVTGRADCRDIADILYVNCSGVWRYLTIYTETDNDGDGPVLDFAEVEVWIPKPTLTTVTPGCTEGLWYGPDCRKSCAARHCKIKSSCDVTQGTCDGGCKLGWRGADCTQVPKPTLTTVTPGCTEGLWYGPDCRKSCATRHCKIKSSCDVTQGTCDGGCKPGWRAADCTQVCPAGVYGVDCSNGCGRCGNNSLCHHETGSCPDRCEAGWQLDLCKDACPNGKYGLNCVAQCGHCNGSCDVVDGRCLQGCTHGYRGPRCLRVIESKKKLPNKMTHSFTKITGLGVLIGGLVGVALTLILALGVYLCLHCRPCKNHRSVKEEETKDTDKSLTEVTEKSLTINKRIETCV
ncbi:uncharacterized protein LOC124264029 isoform X2 [Haliotis rubra]|uniref:uncharacterized protein LOC124264029 isoform X2 n=1 Tax=Haliotis rubra TaxID=36100 RepID=UPI001EE5FFC8|nr:uncharacterized protein LOC124264029 isoform X2 [Haliotis rubra]